MKKSATTEAAPAFAEVAHADEVLLTANEVAGMLRVSPETLANWRSAKTVDLPYIKMGKAVRYRRADVLGFISQSAVSLSTG